jgi:hypothetical protein
MRTVKIYRTPDRGGACPSEQDDLINSVNNVEGTDNIKLPFVAWVMTQFKKPEKDIICFIKLHLLQHIYCTKTNNFPCALYSL